MSLPPISTLHSFRRVSWVVIIHTLDEHVRPHPLDHVRKGGLDPRPERRLAALPSRDGERTGGPISPTRVSGPPPGPPSCGIGPVHPRTEHRSRFRTFRDDPLPQRIRSGTGIWRESRHDVRSECLVHEGTNNVMARSALSEALKQSGSKDGDGSSGEEDIRLERRSSSVVLTPRMSTLAERQETGAFSLERMGSLSQSLQTRRRGGDEETYLLRENSLPVDEQVVASLKSNFLSEAAIDALPPPISSLQRERILRETPQSPTFEVLNRISFQKLTDQSEKGQKLRLKLLRGSVIVFFLAGYEGKRFVYETAKKLGVRCVVVDGPDCWAMQLEDEGIIEKFIPLDMTEAETVFERTLEAIKSMGVDPDGICTFCEVAVPVVSRLSEHLGLPGNPPAAVDKARDKHATREAMREAGLPSPKCCLIESEADFPKAMELVGFPAVIKPINGAASIGVVRVNSEADLRKQYKKVRAEMKYAVVKSGALTQGHYSEEEENEEKESSPQNSVLLQMLMEEYLDGVEIDCDIILSDGLSVYSKITDNWPTYEPWFNETGDNCPSILPQYQIDEMEKLCIGTVKALGLTTGVLHVEAKYTSRGPRLIEVNCRMGGGQVHSNNLAVWGVDLVVEHLLTTIGVPSRPPVPEKPKTCRSNLAINSDTTGIMGPGDWISKWNDYPGVIRAESLVKEGDHVTGPSDGLPSWLAEIWCEAPTVEEAIALVRKIEADVVPPIIPKK